MSEFYDQNEKLLQEEDDQEISEDENQLQNYYDNDEEMNQFIETKPLQGTTKEEILKSLNEKYDKFKDGTEVQTNQIKSLQELCDKIVLYNQKLGNGEDNKEFPQQDILERLPSEFQPQNEEAQNLAEIISNNRTQNIDINDFIEQNNGNAKSVDYRDVNTLIQMYQQDFKIAQKLKHNKDTDIKYDIFELLQWGVFQNQPMAILLAEKYCDLLKIQMPQNQKDLTERYYKNKRLIKSDNIQHQQALQIVGPTNRSVIYGEKQNIEQNQEVLQKVGQLYANGYITYGKFKTIIQRNNQFSTRNKYGIDLTNEQIKSLL